MNFQSVIKKRAHPPPVSWSYVCFTLYLLIPGDVLLCSVQLLCYSFFSSLSPLPFFSRLSLCAMTLPVFFQVRVPWTSPWPLLLFRLYSCPRAACQRALWQPSLRIGGSVSMANQPDQCTQAPYWQHLPRGEKREAILNLKILHGFQMSWMYSPVSCDYHFAACCWLPKSHANHLEDVGSVKNTLPHVQLEPSIIPYKSSSKKYKREVIIIFNINSNY